jgi:hypothetical protein
MGSAFENENRAALLVNRNELSLLYGSDARAQGLLPFRRRVRNGDLGRRSGKPGVALQSEQLPSRGVGFMSTGPSSRKEENFPWKATTSDLRLWPFCPLSRCTCSC